MKEKIYDNVCYGCSACYAACPCTAISMNEDKKGFLYPTISEKCINCKMCMKVCRQPLEFHTVKETYIAKLKDKDLLAKSQSGGAFAAISNEILEAGGVIYGVAMDENLEAMHIRVTSKAQIDKVKGSKYIQSKIGNTYNSVKKDLIDGHVVLFTGTPCQIGGLYKFLKFKKIDIQNLYTIDLICHGVPSILIWRDIIKFYEKKYKQKIKKAVFRNKVVWERDFSTFVFSNNSSINSMNFAKLFYTNLALRDSCYTCEFSRTDRVGDITIGDAWGVKNQNPEFYDNCGVSLILANTKKGLELVSKSSELMHIKNVDLKGYMQGTLKSPSKPGRNKEEFWNDYYKKEFKFILNKYAKNNIFLNIKYILKRIRRKLNEK